MFPLDVKKSTKSKDEQKQELEKRLEDVNGQLGATNKKTIKKGLLFF